MQKNMKKYKVYLLGTGCGCYKKDYCKEFLGETLAVSEKQACSRVRYRMKDKIAKNGGYSEWVVGDYLDEGFVEYKYVAEEV